MRTFKIAATFVFTLLAGHFAQAGTENKDNIAPRGRKDFGWLQVFSACAWESNDDNARAYVHTDYSILNLNGGEVMHVPNAGRTFTWPEPDVVRLPAGVYRLHVAAAGRGVIDMEVKIDAGEHKVVRLDQAESRISKEQKVPATRVADAGRH